MNDRLNRRYYTSVSDFSADFSAILNDTVEPQDAFDATGSAISNGISPSKGVTPDLKQKKALVKRILKATQKLLHEATLKESELRCRPVEQELKNLDNLLKDRTSLQGHSLDQAISKTNGTVADEDADAEGDDDLDFHVKGLSNGPIDPNIIELPHKLTNGVNGVNGEGHSLDEVTRSVHINGGHSDNEAPPTPPLSGGGESYSLSQGGAPWYMEAFSPRGLIVSEEQWTGVRGMSEDLSDMDEDELSELVDAGELKDGPPAGKRFHPSPPTTTVAAATSAKKRKAALARRRRR